MTLDYIADKFGLDLKQKSPISVPISRNGLAQLFAELGFRYGAEIGVETGHYSRVLCQANPDLNLYCVDSWRAYKGYRDHVNQDKLNRFYRDAIRRLKPFKAKIVRKFSMDAVKDFKNETLDFVYLDANHEFQAVTNDIVEWGKKVKVGGIISGHDFESHRGPSLIHVKEVVEGYTKAYKIAPWFLTDDNQREDETRGARSFFWVKC